MGTAQLGMQGKGALPHCAAYQVGGIYHVAQTTGMSKLCHTFVQVGPPAPPSPQTQVPPQALAHIGGGMDAPASPPMQTAPVQQSRAAVWLARHRQKEGRQLLAANTDRRVG
jgi:hypothetical protein